MLTKKILLGLPLAVIAIMVQSVFWVPTQTRQGEVNPKRLLEFYEGSIGDASILNPILNADSASSNICDKVFDGLLRYDLNLQYEGQLATSWEISEEAYLWIDPTQRFPDGSPITAERLRERILAAVKKATTDSPLRAVTGIKILGPATEHRAPPDEAEFLKENLSQVEVHLPSRLLLSLSTVQQDLFAELEAVYGKNYLAKIASDMHLSVPKNLTEPAQKKLIALAREIIPPAEHNPVILFQLRNGVFFHDGYPFTADDVLFTYQSIMNPRNLSPRTSDYEPIKTVTVLDPLQVRVVYKRLYAPAIGTWGMGILPKHLLEEKALAVEAARLGRDPKAFTMRDSDFNRHPVGTGAFIFQEWKPAQYLHLTRNEKYWEGAPNYHDYYYRIIPDTLAQEMELYAGTLDAYDPEPHQIERMKNHPDYQSFSALSLGYSYIGYNLRRDKFKDPRVRQALAMAIDVDALIKYIHYGHAEHITGPFPKQTAYYDAALPPLPYDPKKALELFREAGWIQNAQGQLVHEKTGKQFQFTLMTNNGNEIRKGIMTVAQQAWNKLGILVSTQTVEWAVFIQKHVDVGEFDAIVLGWKMGIDPDLYQIWHSSQTNPKQLNFVGYQNLIADELIVRIRQEYDHEKWVTLCHRLHQVIYKDQPYTFLTATRGTVLMDRRIMRQINTPQGPVYKKIEATKAGIFSYHFNQWIKIKEPLLSVNK